MMVHSADHVKFTDMPLLQSLTVEARRPNLLVAVEEHTTDAVLTSLKRLCQEPIVECTLPGALRLPTSGAGTLLLHDVAALTIGQQIELFDWMGDRGNTQVVSVTETSVLELIRDRRFLERLFYRLNTVFVV